MGVVVALGEGRQPGSFSTPILTLGPPSTLSGSRERPLAGHSVRQRPTTGMGGFVPVRFRTPDASKRT